MDLSTDLRTDWEELTKPIAQRFDREVEVQLGKAKWDIPPDIVELDFWQACQTDHLLDRLGTPFHEVQSPKKRDKCLDIGCGVSYLLYPWVHWGAEFYGHDLSPSTVQFVQSRGSQLNSKLFKRMEQGVAHQLSRYEGQTFDLAIATGFLYYYPLDYFKLVWGQLRPLLAPKANVVIDIVNSESPWADEWGLLEMEKGAEPLLTNRQEWETCFQQIGAQVQQQMEAELFITYKLSPAS